jgi:hypothetical protein
MIYHNVLFKFSAQATEAQVQQLSASLEALTMVIPQIKFLKMRENFSDRNRGFTHMLASGFETLDDLKAYASHPAHVRIIEQQIKPIAEEIVVGDIEA